MGQRDSAFAGRRVLILEQGFLKGRKGKPVHGVELFRLLLIEQMLERGVHVTVTAERSWRVTLEERFGEGVRASGADRGTLKIVYTPNLGGALSNGIVAALATRRASFDAVMFGDARRGLIPAVLIAGRAHRGTRLLLFAHRRPHERVLARTGAVGYDVVAVSEFVAERFRGRVPGSVGVMYGLADAERWYPAQPGEKRDDGLVHFVLVGRLPNVSKGHERAIEAFGMLRADVRARCRLHLASFIRPAGIEGEGVIAHDWIPGAEMPGFLRGMDAMLALSSNETFSQAIVQGMLTGLPVVATGLPVYVEKLDEGGGGGGIVARETGEISAAMERLAGDAALRTRLGEAGRRTALARYVWDTDRFLSEHLFRS